MAAQSSRLTEFERRVLEAFLAGEDPALPLLRRQAEVCSVTGRRHSAVGSFTELTVPDAVGRISPPAMTMGDVDLQVSGLPRGATAMLFVRLGALSQLEFVSNEGDWPMHPVATGISYIKYQPRLAGGYTFVPTATRDHDTLLLQLAGHKSSNTRLGKD